MEVSLKSLAVASEASDMIKYQPRASTPYGILGKLPKEIRLQIYGHLFNNRYTFSVPKTAKHKHQMADIDVLMTSSAILTETRQLFYERGLFVIKLLPPKGYCYICRGVASAALIKKVELEIEIGSLEFKYELREELRRHSRKRLGNSLAGAHDRDLYWTIPEWFQIMSLSTCSISFARPLRWTPPSIWCLAYVYLVLGLCNMCIDCDTVALGVDSQDPDWSKTSSTFVRVAECHIDRLRKKLERFLGPGIVKDLSPKTECSAPLSQATLQYHPSRHNDRFPSEAWEEDFRIFPSKWTKKPSDPLAVKIFGEEF